MSEAGSASKRHNPVDSICRKIKTIQMRDQDSNPNLQIPKFQSRNFDSPQSNTKKNLEEMLKNRTVKNNDKDLVSFSPNSSNAFSPSLQLASPCHRQVAECDSPLGNATYSLNLMLKDRNRKIWSSCRAQSCSTPVVHPGDLQFKFCHSAVPNSSIVLEERPVPSTPGFYFADRKSEPITLQSPVVKRLSLSETGGLRRVVENKTEATSEISLICEEDLLDSIFHACDTEHRGKVAVSKIVDYLRHTTSRGLEDSGLDELCNMLDPERKDISMDLDTYHAIMKEWIDDCRNNCAEEKTKESVLGAEDSMFKLREGFLAVRRISGTMNITSGSLEAFGGDVSRGDLETSDLITCVADLQYNNQKLQDQHQKLKSTIEALEEANHRLLEENEELHNQWKSAQQSIMRARTLKEELDEMKMNMNSSEERKAQVVLQNKQLEKDNISLIHKISSLQEENMRNTVEAEGLRKTILEFTDKAAVLQVQLSDSENTLQKKDTSLHMKDLYIEELKSTLMEYVSVIENLRTEKTKLENDLQQMEQELLSNGITSPITHKFNRIMTKGLNSLHSELELAQKSPDVSVAEWMSPSGQNASLDVTLDREVLIMLQGPAREQVAAEFKAIMQNLQEETCDMSDLVLVSLQRLIDSDTDVKDLPGRMLEIIKADLKEKRNTWTQKLKQLEKHRDCLDKDFVRMAGNLRRLKTEQVHMRKELTSRLHELDTVRQQQEEAEGRVSAILAQLEDCSAQKEEFAHKSCSDWELLDDDSVPPLNAEPGNKDQKSCFFKRFCLQESNWLSRPHKTTLIPDPLCVYTPLLDALTLEILQLYPRLSARNYPHLAARKPLKCGTSKHKDLSKSSGSEAASLKLNKCRLVSFGVQTDVEILDNPAMQSPMSEESEPDQRRVTADVSSSGYALNPSEATDGISGSLENTLISSEPDAELLMMDVNDTASRDFSAKDGETGSTEGSALDSLFVRDISPEGPMSENTEVKSADQGAASHEGSCAPAIAPSSAVTEAFEEKNSTNNEKAMEAEFLRLSLGFKCDLFTLDKRLRLEERSRDLAEENLKKEIASCTKLLEALSPLCEDDNQSHEIVKKLEKSLQFLGQHTTRVASRAEMLGAIHQESRVSKAVEVMIQHVENLKRMYAKEHAELEELKEVLQQNDRSGSSADRVLASTQCRVIVTPRYLPSQPQDPFGGEKVDGKMHKRSNSWKLVGSKPNDNRLALQQRFTNYPWTEPTDEPIIREDEQNSDLPDCVNEENIRKCSFLEKNSPTETFTMFGKVNTWASDLKNSISTLNKPIVISLLAVLLLAALVSFLTGLSFQRPVDGAPVGTGDSWTSLQQLLWPYTGLHHNGQPPV
ncbi:inositol 1,4,5-triphosphate receptor associated 2 [Rhinophrynus dorsalis]